MGKQHFLQQAYSYKTTKHTLVGRCATVKLDGIRGLWDGGVTRGMLKSAVPWANCTKDNRYKEPQYATGLWTRYGNVIHAPEFFLDALPIGVVLDGELWAGRGRHQYTRSVVSRLIPDKRWLDITLGVFNSPNLQEIFHNRSINLKDQYEKDFCNILSWLAEHNAPTQHKGYNMDYMSTQKWLEDQTFWNTHVEYVAPMLINTIDEVEQFYLHELEKGGEGVIFTEPDSTYTCERVHTQVKCKPFKTEEATVIGYTTGRETDRGSKLLGLMGSMRVVTASGAEFDLSGFTDKERLLISIKNTLPAYTWAANNPECSVPDDIEAMYFKRGTQITFKYRELSDAGVPKEAAYYRKREIE